MVLEKSKTEMAMELRNFFRNSKLDSQVLGQTIRVDTTFIDQNVLLKSSAKLIRVNRREEEPDDRDDLKYSVFPGYEDFVKEHIEKDAKKLYPKVQMKMRGKKNLDWLTAGYFTQQVRSVVVSNALSQNLEGNNPLELWDVSNKVTKMGPGGISSTTAIPDESRQVNSSQFGVFDPLHMVESETIGVTNYFTRNVRKGLDGKIYRKMLDKNKKEVWITVEEMLNSVVEIPDS